ncbi:hypothetical protein CASFOL_001172 [Castilleja foliolosa]|uniref:NB-ARC domain-containing protein n=1 Tax=Castilleja foliolosa TaxID=1961234 RepID=A0ABD3EMB8_9LAMI
MIGSSDIISQIMDLPLLTHWPNPRTEMVALVGMAGIGKTTLAKKVYEDSSFSSRFDRCAWVDVGRKYQATHILQSILSQLTPETDKVLTREDEGEDDDNFYEILEGNGKRYIIVLDDVWDSSLLDYFDDSLPRDSSYRILILFTTRLEHLGASSDMFRLRFLNNEESWDLLREKVFGDDQETTCPPELVKAGKKIAENCDGLPLVIVTVANLLIKADKKLEYWNKVASEKQNQIFTDAYDRISKILYPSYEYLPQHLRALFLYMAVFPQNYVIPVAKLSMLWAAEGFFETGLLDYTALLCLEDFVRLSLVLYHESSYNYRLKTCSLHSVFWHLCVKEAGRNKLFHVLNKYTDSSEDCIRNQRRLCIHNNVLFTLQDVHTSMESSSNARSLLCTGPYHKYPVPICFGHFRLLRVIDTLTIRSYEFPAEVLKLVQLIHLAFIYDGKLPSTISKLLNLRFLIVHRHLSIITLYESSYLPIEIWDMKELKHIQVTGSTIPDPRNGDILPNLVTLLDISARSCTEAVVEGLPKLKKLRIQIELMPDTSKPWSWFDHISNLKKLKSLICVCVNPEMRSKLIVPPFSSSLFPERLQKLSLSGLGYPWKDIKVFASLPFLSVLKLQCYAFRGPEWEIKEGDFVRLRVLQIEDTDLVKWIIGNGGFVQWLECLILKNLYKLEYINGEFSKYLQSVEIVDCNLFAVKYGKQLQKDNSDLKLSVQSSWDDGKLKRSKPVS